MPYYFTGSSSADEWGYEEFPRSPLPFHFGAMPFGDKWTIFCKYCDRTWKLKIKESYTTEELAHFVRHIETNCGDIPRLEDYYDYGDDSDG